ncbi:MAG: hypothetical protein QMD71_04120 [bacterium]|nr:hypothetical protein [bacterium]
MVNIIIILLLSVLGIIFVAIVIKHWDWMPVILLPILWYIPRQTATGGLLENYLLLRWISVFIIPLIIYIQFVKICIRAQPIELSNIALPLGVFIGFSVFSGIVNNAKPFDMLVSLVLHIRYPLLFIVLINMDIREDVVKVFYRCFIFLLAIQIPECVYRYTVLGISGDYLSFTLGPWGHFDLGVYAIYAIALLTASDVVNGIKISHLIFYAFLSIPLLFGEIKAMIYSVPIVVIITIYAALKAKAVQKRSDAILLIVFFLILFCFIYGIWDRIYSDGGMNLIAPLRYFIKILRNPALFLQTKRLPWTVSRIYGGVFVIRYFLKEGWSSLLFGTGPGSMLAGSFTGTPGKLVSIPLYLNQISAILGEVGIIGLIIYYWMLLRVLLTIKRVSSSVADTNLNIFSLGLVGMWIFYAVLGPFYDLVWRHDSPNYIFYFLTAVVYKHYMSKISRSEH